MAEVVLITVACVAMTVIPQAAESSQLDLHHFEADWPQLAKLANLLALDRVTEAPWFLALAGIALASLGLVLVEQVRLLLQTWRRPLTEVALLGSAYVAVFDRPARGAAGVLLKQSGRLGLAGSPLLHLGLVLCVLAGFGAMLVGRAAVIDLVEGEALAAGATTGWGKEWGGPLSQPLSLEHLFLFQELTDVRYPSGELKALSAKVRIGEGPAARQELVAVNTPLDIGAERVYLTSMGGAAALLEVGRGGELPTAALLRPASSEAMEYSGTVGGIELHLRAGLSKTGALPKQMFARVLVDGGMRYSGPLAVGQGVDLGDGRQVVMRGVRHWSQFRARRDATLWLAWLGLGSGVLGALLIYGISPVAWMIRVDSEGERERVTIRMKPVRFAPLFAEKFDALVRAEGGKEGQP